jgi:hypothetical protein
MASVEKHSEHLTEEFLMPRLKEQDIVLRLGDVAITMTLSRGVQEVLDGKT